MEEVLRLLLPRIVRPDIEIEYRQFGSKDNLLKQLPSRLRAYAEWLPQNAMVLVVVDRDDDDCIRLKEGLDEIAQRAGLVPKSRAAGGRFQVINRIAVEELESWFFGDWVAVREAYPRLPDLSRKAAYRDPDAIGGGTWEALERELKYRGYFNSGLRKREFARSVAPHMDPQANSSRSFCCLRDVVALL